MFFPTSRSAADRSAEPGAGHRENVRNISSATCLHGRMSTFALAPRLVLALALGTLSMACSGGSRCKSDGDCKGSRICQKGECMEPASATPTPAPQPQQPGAAPQQPGAAPPQPPQPPAAPAGPQGQLVAPPSDACVTPPPQNRNGILRAAPSLDAAEVVQVPRGTPIQVVGESGLFYSVILPNTGHRGWMNRNAITLGACPGN